MPYRDLFYIDFTLKNLIRVLNAKSYNILDVGGAFGLQAHFLSSSFKRHGIKVMITVLDVDLPMLLKGKGSYSTLNFVRGDAHHLPFRSNAFDLIYSFSLLEHLREPETAIGEQVRVSKMAIVVQIPNLYYIIEPHTKAPLLYMYPDKARRKVVEISNPGMQLNFKLSYKTLIKWFNKNGSTLANIVKIYHVKWAQVLFAPQGYLALFLKKSRTI